MSPEAVPRPVALLGGTGRSGPGLALRLAIAGVPVLIGSRDAGRAETVAGDAENRLRSLGHQAAPIGSGTNLDVSERCGMAMVTVPHEGVTDVVRPLAEALADKVVVSTVVPVRFEPEIGPIDIEVAEGSAAEQIAALLPTSMVSAGFHSLSSTDLRRLEHGLDSHVAVAADDDRAREATMALANLLPGVRAVDAGPLRSARHCEHLTVLLMAINRTNGVRVGVRFTGLRQ